MIQRSKNRKEKLAFGFSKGIPFAKKRRIGRGTFLGYVRGEISVSDCLRGNGSGSMVGIPFGRMSQKMKARERTRHSENQKKRRALQLDRRSFGKSAHNSRRRYREFRKIPCEGNNDGKKWGHCRRRMFLRLSLSKSLSPSGSGKLPPFKHSLAVNVPP